MSVPTRRERLRTATLAEIKENARRLLTTGGPQAISLRAIARDMGMTAPAIYRYFPSLDALVAAVVGDLFEEMRNTVEAARRSAGDDDPVRQLVAMARAFRHWAIGHPVEFGLIFGTPVPELASVRECGDPQQPSAQLGAQFIQPIVELWRRGPLPAPPRDRIERRLGRFLQPLRENHGDLPIEVAYIFLSAWARLYGLVAMEVFRQFDWAVTEAEALFELELEMFTAQLLADRPTRLPDGPTGVDPSP
ncbi:TetR/AcrR family transcriptional regulator [Micromonospora sonneratiae]|uniref:TetR/AcrR family transcriptional regulator n=1 Tax=Micromonospora sonneratiae TaxID=1184706 RepID=A0ABW3YGZ8_9ACTN